jgi:stress-induced morphogen
MAMSPGEIEGLIKQAIPDAQINIEDLRGDGDHYAAYVVSTAFKGKTRVQQHQMIYQALQGRMGNELHACTPWRCRPRRRRRPEQSRPACGPGERTSRGPEHG